MLTTLIVAPALLFLQDVNTTQTAGTDSPAATQGKARNQPAAVSAAPLRDRIHNLRRDLLAGGEWVRQAETEAADFYRSKIHTLDKQGDDLTVDRAERRAAYRVALDRTLAAKDETTRAKAASDAAAIHDEMKSLDAELEGIAARRREFSRGIEIVEARRRERERLTMEFETSGLVVTDPSFVSGGLGFAPETPAPKRDPLANTAFLKDLIERDPERAKQIVFELDPELYWKTWPLQPPVRDLRRAMRLPAPDRKPDRD